MRADALQNRQRLLEAARTMFQEHGLDVTVGEIADAAGIGRGTVFRNFPTKDHLIAAVVSDAIREGLEAGRTLLATATDDTEIVFQLISDLSGFQQTNRAVLEAVADEFLAYPEMQAAHMEMLQLMNEVLDRGKSAGAIRPEVTAMDVLTLLKGMCMNPRLLDGSDPDTMLRYLELIRAAITTPEYSRPLRGAPPIIPAPQPVAP